MPADIGPPTCPSCGASVSGSTRFCTSCGAALPTFGGADPVVRGRVIGDTAQPCASCGKPVATGVSFCTHCGARVAITGDATIAVSRAVPPPAPPAVVPATPVSQPGRSKTPWIVAGSMAAAVALIAVVVGVIASSGGGGADASPARPRTRHAPAATPETIAPTLPPTTVRVVVPATSAAPAAAARGPQTYVVSVGCSGRTCALAVRDLPNTSGAKVASIDSGATVTIACSTRGELVVDQDSGHQSDAWLRLDGVQQYVSSLYAQGPPVPTC